MKTILVTGANAGMGFATAKQLAKAGMHVILYCRSAERGQAAQQRLKEETGNSAIDLVIGDLGSLASVRKSAAEINARFKKLDVLINNAGIVNLKKEQTTDGFEQMLGVNYVGHFELTRQLLPLLKRADAGRIVNVASGAYKFVKKKDQRFFDVPDFFPWREYGRSKKALILFTDALAFQLRNTTVTANALHPGAVATSLGVSRQTGFGQSIYKMLTPFFKTAEEGADTAIYLALSPDVAGISGHYFVDRQAVPTEITKEQQQAQKLWQETQQRIADHTK
ncbi:SDR family oxidoreductase [Enterococcus innesii]|uniref:SDR family oxidoreductase n=1 Tax=Enterococcus innesii TaxID=2839759 RepID=UPI000AAB703E|nr:SDR family oxidoreductase [Enterococcus innesii]MEB5919405.1 SDR family oxidoreductase [Enterococcus innesii]